MDKINDIIPGIISKISNSNDKQEKDLEFTFEQIVRPEEWKMIKIVGIKEGTLCVHVKAPAILYQMKAQKDHILRNLQLDFPEIQRLYFKIGKIT